MIKIMFFPAFHSTASEAVWFIYRPPPGNLPTSLQSPFLGSGKRKAGLQSPFLNLGKAKTPLQSPFLGDRKADAGS
jgi:hypothetical protein